MKNQRKHTNAGIDYRNSSSHLTKTFDMMSIIDYRLKIALLVIALLSSVLLFKAYDIQVANASSYEAKYAKLTSNYLSVSPPRGEIVDRNGRPLVSNVTKNTIIYTYTSVPDNLTMTKDAYIWELADKFANRFVVTGTLTRQEKAALWIRLFPTEADALLNSDEKELTTAQQYSLQLARVTDEQVNVLSKEQQVQYFVYLTIINATTTEMNVVVDQATVDDILYLVEHSADFPGFSYYVDWDRNYNQDDLKSILGQVTTSAQGLLAENADYYLAMGYSLNQRVGRSGLELEYESLLAGQKTSYVYNNTGSLEVVKSGSSGNTLVTSFDLGLQQYTKQVVTETMQSLLTKPNLEYWKGTYVIVSDVNTGDILASIAYKRTDDGTLYYDEMATFVDSMPVGSSVKGATVYIGQDSGVMPAGTVINDAPIKLKGTEAKASYHNYGLIDDLGALYRSSNVYMFYIAMKLAGYNYVYDTELIFKNPDVFQVMRNYYARFGLGVKTEIDFPTELTGYTGDDSTNGKLLDFAIGQYDTYTPLQLSQYINTIANGGKRIKPRLVQYAVDPTSGSIVYENPVTVLNTLDNTTALARIREGFRLCVTGTQGICHAFASSKTEVATKTGTAEDFYFKDGQAINVTNSLGVSFAPYDNPKYSVACAAYHIENSTNFDALQPCGPITSKIYDYLFSQTQ